MLLISMLLSVLWFGFAILFTTIFFIRCVVAKIPPGIKCAISLIVFWCLWLMAILSFFRFLLS